MWTGIPRGGEGAAHRLGCGLATALLLAGAVPVLALSTDRDQPIEIVADGAEHDDARRTTTYRGNVVIDQGSLHITGDTVVVMFDARNRVAKITSVGTPAHFRQLSEGDSDYRKAWASTMEYFPEQDLINLSGAARYEKDGSRVQADRLVYDSLNARFRALTDAAPATVGDGAQAAGDKPARVTIRIQPRKKSRP